MPVDKFGRMSDTKTKDTGVSLTYINNNYVRSDGSNPVTGSIDMRGNTLYNVSDPVNPQDVATKEYADKVGGGDTAIYKTQYGTYGSRGNIDMRGYTLTLYHTIPTFNDPQERSLLKTLWEKEKMLVTSIFSFSQNVFNTIKDKNNHFKYFNFVVC